MRHWVIHPTILLLSMLWKKRHYFLMKVMQCGLYTWGMRWVVPRIRFTWHHAALPDWKIAQGYVELEPCDVIVTMSKWQLTSMCIPGEVKHAALFVGGQLDQEIAEMVCSGWQSSSWRDVCQASRVVILRCDEWRKDDYFKLVIAMCKSFVGTLYDVQFTLSIKLLSCAEMLWHCDPENRAEVSTKDILGLGRPYITPQAYYKSKKMRVVWDSDNALAG